MAKILVIEDDSAVRTLIHSALRMHRFEVYQADQGEMGVQLAKRHGPDLIICDIRMPKMDGFATLQALRADPVTATIPFIFLTGFSDRSDLRQGMELGADDYLTKPFTLSELLAAVTTRLNKHSEVQRRSEEKLEELRANISLALPHELLTPLNGILGFAGILADDAHALAAAEVTDYARQIQESADRLRRLIENFLLYSQIELILANPKHRGGQVSKSRSSPVREVVEQVARSRAQRAGRHADLMLNVVDATAAVGGDDLRKVIEELVDNAFKFSDAGKAVRVTVAVEAGVVTISIGDSGRGFTADQIAKVGAHMQFERRFHEQQGSGLGLIIAKRLTELHHGTFRIESVPGAGSTVRLEFSRT